MRTFKAVCLAFAVCPVIVAAIVALSGCAVTNCLIDAAAHTNDLTCKR